MEVPLNQALKRNHLVAPQPPRRRQALKRFERELPNDLWQIDATQVALAAGEPAWVVDVVDDHARYLLAAFACTRPSGEAVVDIPNPVDYREWDRLATSLFSSSAEEVARLVRRARLL